MLKSDLYLAGLYIAASVLCFYGIAEGHVLTTFGLGSSRRSSSLVNTSELNLRYPRQTKQCDDFKCKTTQECIGEEKRCDGTVDCLDGSDEFNDCREEVLCPSFYFTCDYGACIKMKKKCNGQKDCRDNSDEANCVINTDSNKTSTNCKSDQFQCNSGQCISLDDKCNGKPQCDDRSDETKETCLNVYCPVFTAKCAYGGCVSVNTWCNGVKDCIDNSDEENCRLPAKPTPIPTNRSELVTDRCTLPSHPQNGKWSVLSGVVGTPNEKVVSNTILKFECNKGYKLSSENQFVICKDDEWIPNMPSCRRKCPPIYSTAVTNIKCYESGTNIEVKCDEATNGTSATFTCAPYYEPVGRSRDIRYCWEGTWNLPPPLCQPVCGMKKVSAESLIVNGTPVKTGDFAWVTAIYRRSDDGNYKNVCTGSMLTQKVILTAAHCVSTDLGHTLPKENVLVGVGIYYYKYKDARDTQAQYSELEKIQVHPYYKGGIQNYANDIALLVTRDELLLSKVVQPVCYQDLPNIELRSGQVGVVSGWGEPKPDKNSPSEELMEKKLPLKSQEECSKELPEEWIDKYYTSDKMCAGYYNRSISVCIGDSGGGLVFKNFRDNRYYVHGIVSVAHYKNASCDRQASSLFTKVVNHYSWLEKIVSFNKISPLDDRL